MSDNNKKKPALGRGLSALLSDAGSVNDPNRMAQPALPTNFHELEIEKIEPNAAQPRTDFDEKALVELAESIIVQGIIQPITVRRLEANKFQIISGERRYRASKLAGLKVIPAYIREANDQEMLEMALIENIQRQDLNAVEVAISYQRLIAECNLKQEQLGERVGKDRTTVNNYLRLLKLPPDILKGLREGKLSMGHAKTLINIENAEDQLFLFNKIVNEDLSVRRAEELVRELHQAKKPKATAKPVANYEIDMLQSKLSGHFGTKIFIKADGNNKGEIKIPFLSTEDLNRILEILNM
jgi:ParB family transcriptional regulator, chromosome partitioning protein